MIATARTLDKAQAACRALSGDTLPLECELADPASVRRCVESVKRAGFALDAIIANAGVMAVAHLEKSHGYELQFFTNHVGHFMLVTGLVEQLTETGRVVMLSSSAHRMAPKVGIDFDNLDGAKGYSAWPAYGQSKLANLLFAKQLARRFAPGKRTANAVHPGVIRTNLQRHMNPVLSLGMTLGGPLALKSVTEGAATEVYVATHPSLAGVSGQFFADCNVARPRADAEDADLALRLWETTEQIVSKLP